MKVHGGRPVGRKICEATVRWRGFAAGADFPEAGRVDKDAGERYSQALEHDPEKWVSVFGKDHAPPIS